jgi:hypothetical protein
MLEALESRRAGKDLPVVDKIVGLSVESFSISRSTLKSVEKRLGSLPITRGNCFNEKNVLLSVESVKSLMT